MILDNFFHSIYQSIYKVPMCQTLLPQGRGLFGPRLDVWVRPQRRDGFWIYIGVTLAVIFLDVLEIGRGLDTGHVPVHVLQPPVEIRVAMPYTPYHELEMLLVYCVEAYDGCIELDVYLCRVWCAEHVGGRGFSGHLLEPVQGLEDDFAILLVFFLGICEAGFVDAVVEVGHHPAVHVINPFPQFGRVGIKVSSFVAIGQIVVKGMVQHAHNILTLIVHNLICLLIPQNGHAVFSLVVCVRLEVNLV